MDKEKLIIIDGNALVHRAYHALPPLTSKKGELVNAVYGFFLVFFRAIKGFQPDFVVATFDYPAPNLRHYKYKLYKANRVKAPDELYSQIPMIKEILTAFEIPIFEKEGYEADDIIGTISKTAPKKQAYPEIESIIVSGDADVLQLVDKNTKAYILRKGVKDIVLYDEEKVKEKFDGLNPEEIVDFKALRGDPSDNIPGIFGIGEKTAISLIKKFGSLDNLYEELKKNTEDIKELKETLRKKITDYKEQAYVSKMLAEIRKDAPIDFDLDKCKWGNYNKSKVIEIFENYGFSSLVKRLEEAEAAENFQAKKSAQGGSASGGKNDNENNLKLW